MKTGTKIALAVGTALGVTGLLGAALVKRTIDRKKQAMKDEFAQEDAEEKARFDGEGGSMQPVEIHA